MQVRNIDEALNKAERKGLAILDSRATEHVLKDMLHYSHLEMKIPVEQKLFHGSIVQMGHRGRVEFRLKTGH